MNIFTWKKGAILGLIGAVLMANADNIDYEYAWDHSLYPPFTDLKGNMVGWDYKALINSYSFIRLTTDTPSSSGYLFSTTPFEATDWFIEFAFEIGGESRFAGDGMAFWWTERAFQGGAAFGHDESFRGLGVFFDTFRNGDHAHSFPYVGAMIGDGFKPYHHENDGMGTLIGGCHADIVNTEHSLRAKIIYAAKTLEVLLELNPNDGWTTCFKVPNVQLPIKRGFLGFTAATGEAHSRHDILSITAAKIDKAQAERFVRGQVFRMTERVRGGHFLGLLVVVSVVGGLYYLYTTNRKKTRF